MKLKVCGMKYQANIDAVARLQPHYMGFIFYDKSPRFSDLEHPKLPNNIKKVGVFVNDSISSILEKVKKCQLEAVQLHGQESPKFCKDLKDLSNKASLEIIKVFSVADDFDFSVLNAYEKSCDYYLFDTKGKLPGGNGYAFNWNVLNNYPSTKPYFLSGGIGPEELETIQKFMKSTASRYCYALDVNSKFETSPGLKDLELLKEFKEKMQ